MRKDEKRYYKITILLGRQVVRLSPKNTRAARVRGLIVMAHEASERGMSIEYTKVDAANRQAFYETLLTFWDQRWDRDFQQELLDAIAPRLNWKHLLDTHDFVLPITA
jgi:hypothetical protein